MYSNYGYYPTNSISGLTIWTIISLVVAIGGGIFLYFTYLKEDKKLDGTLSKIRDFFTFKTLMIEGILKISYLIICIFITLYSFGLIGTNVVLFLVTLFGGNIALRLTYEISILLIKICKNTTEINNKLKK